MKIKYLPLILALAFNKCNLPEERQEFSDILYEPAIVTEVAYSPSRHGSGSGVGPTIDFDGNVGIAITHVSVDVPEKYAVVFKCKHGKFISEGSDQRHKELWERFYERDSVTVSYKEIFKSVYQDKNDDGKKDLVSRTLIAYDFLDAQVIKKTKK